MRLLRVPEPFDHAEFIFEPKIDGFRALAHIDGHRCRLVSRNDHVFNSWPQLSEEIAHAMRVNSAIIDREICCLDADGSSNFKKLLFRREWPHFYAFDLLAINGRDIRGATLVERKKRLLRVLPMIDSRVLYLDHVVARGRDLCNEACGRDLEGIVAKWAHGNYDATGQRTSWFKVKNPDYTQILGRRELFEARRDPHRRARRVASLDPRMCEALRGSR